MQNKSRQRRYERTSRRIAAAGHSLPIKIVNLITHICPQNTDLKSKCQDYFLKILSFRDFSLKLIWRTFDNRGMSKIQARLILAQHLMWGTRNEFERTKYLELIVYYRNIIKLVERIKNGEIGKNLESNGEKTGTDG